ncbi:MAG: Nif3-like dinuclear metal center hexameric protein [Synergistaceae bacterium]|nr:Nif3-like dinuclear metal center hexameric protein [Synergistaceae bacterium]
MKVREIVERIEKILPRSWSEEWDKVGLMIGDPESSVDRIAVALDATERSVRDASAKGCRMLVTHHPAIFQAVERILHPSPMAGMISASMTDGVAVYSAHTNWDSSPSGVNVILSRLLGLEDVLPIEPRGGGAWGMGAIGLVPGGAVPVTLARMARDAWGLSSLMIHGNDEKPIRMAALCGGSGSEFLQEVIDLGADVYITADVGYHYLLHAQLSGMRIIEVNHGEMERASLPGLCDLVRDATGLETELLDDFAWPTVAIGPRVIVLDGPEA